jgi:RNA polymerase sigma-70 factor (ECF subfamily)
VNLQQGDKTMSPPAAEYGALLTAARAGSREALGKALEACRRYLLLIAEEQLTPELRAKGGASDLVQETFLEAQRDFPQFHGSTQAELLAWLRRVLLNNLGSFTRHFCATDKRAVAREVALPGDGSSADAIGELAAPPPSPCDVAIAREQIEGLRQALVRLPEDYRQVILLRYEGGHSFEEIGRRLGRSPDAARKLWTRAVEHLQDEWETHP